MINMTLPGFTDASLSDQNGFRHSLIRNFVTSMNSITPAKLTPKPNPDAEFCGTCNAVRENARECKQWVQGGPLGGGYWYRWYEDCCPPGYTWYQKGFGSYSGKCCKRQGKFETCLS